MDPQEHAALIEQAVAADPENIDTYLGQLGLAGLPSKEDVHRQIEEKLLLSRPTLPSHWLPTYQVSVCIDRRFFPTHTAQIMGHEARDPCLVGSTAVAGAYFVVFRPCWSQRAGVWLH